LYANACLCVEALSKIVDMGKQLARTVF